MKRLPSDCTCDDDDNTCGAKEMLVLNDSRNSFLPSEIVYNNNNNNNCNSSDHAKKKRLSAANIAFLRSLGFIVRI